MLEAMVDALPRVFALGPILGMLAVLPLALLSGALPGGGVPISIAILGMAGVLPAEVAIAMIVFQASAGDITQPIPSILFGVPGSRASQATVLDGYPLAKQGRAAEALGASYATTLIGGLIAAVLLFLFLPVAREMLLLFGSGEFFLLSVLGVMAVGIVSSGAYIKGLLGATMGFAIAMIGTATGAQFVMRGTFGMDFLMDGIGLVPLVIGLFALPEAIDLIMGDEPISGDKAKDINAKTSRADLWKGFKIAAFHHKWLVLRSSVIGVAVGALPALGGSVAHWVAYAQARVTEKGAAETFGKGDIRGVIASDAANNSSDGGQLMPTVAFGIPGSAGMAIVMALLILNGIIPGRDMLTTDLDVTISLVYLIALANIVVVPILFAMGPLVVKLSAIPPRVLTPPIIAVVVLIAFFGGGQAGGYRNLGIVAAFTALGVFMKRYGWPRIPILIAVVLGDIVERYFDLTMQTMGWEVFRRPQFLIILVLMLLLVGMSVRLQRRIDKTKNVTESTATTSVE